MPKLKRSTEIIKAAYLTGVIKKYMAVANMSVQVLSKKTGVPASTLYLKIREPSGFKYSELFALVKVLGIPASELLEIFDFKEAV